MAEAGARRRRLVLTDAVRDAAGHAREFCGGKAHAEMSLMAQALWREVGPPGKREVHRSPAACVAPLSS